MKLGTVLTVLTVIATAMAVLFVLHEGTDSSSAEIIDEGQCGPAAYYRFDSDGTLEIYGSGEMYNYIDIELPPWYDYRADVKKVVIGDSITHLGYRAFSGCPNLRELTIPITLNSVSSDSDCAFLLSTYIKKINFTCGKDGYGFNYSAYEGSNSWYQNTPWYMSRDYLEEINFADGIIHIGNDAFRELNLTKIVLPDSVTSLGHHTFFNCTKLTDLTIPISLNPYDSVDYPAFHGCTAIENVTFTKGNGIPFDYCTSKWWGPCQHTDLAPWNMNSGIAKKIVISDDVTDMGQYMFYNTNIKELTIPISADCAKSGAFITGDDYDSLKNVTITKGTGIGSSSNESYYKYNPWNRASNIETLTIEEGVTNIAAETFYYVHADKVVLPNSLTTLGRNVFGEYTSIPECVVKELTLPIDLDVVVTDDYQYWAFCGISGIEKITFTPGYTGRGCDYSAYSGSDCWYKHTPWYICRDTLKEIVFKDGIVHIGSDAFRELNITSLILPDSMQCLDNHAFYQCTKLRYVSIPITLDSTYSAKYPAFDQCNAISILKLTAGRNGIGFDYTGYMPFWCGLSLKSISFDSGISYIGAHTLDGYRFVGPDGGSLEPVAANLSGHLFAGSDGVMYQKDCASGDPVSAVMSDPVMMSDKISVPVSVACIRAGTGLCA